MDLDNRYSRQTLTYGKDASIAVSKSKILISCKTGFNGAALELAKCCIMTGFNTVDLHSKNFDLQFTDLASNYYIDILDLESISKITAFEKIRSNLSNLNPNVNIRIKSTLCDYDFYDTIIFANYTLEEAESINLSCRSLKVKTIFIWTYGLMGSIFCDFIDHKITDITGNPIKTGFVKSIESNRVITTEPHKMDTGDIIIFEGEETLNSMYEVDVHDTTSFSLKNKNLNDKPTISARFKEIRKIITKHHESLRSAQKTILQNIVRFDMKDWDRPTYLIAFHRALSLCTNLQDVPKIKLYNLFRLELKLLDSDLYSRLDTKIFDLMYYTFNGTFIAIDSIIGSIAAQEVIKSVSHKYDPINQFMYLDALDVLPSDYIEDYIKDRINRPDKYLGSKTRSDGLVKIFGDLDFDINVFVVGSGAVGCEHLKGLVMLGIKNIHITDMDNIELSNLNRQFLFDQNDIKKPKSICAASKARLFNPNVNIHPKTLAVCKDTEHIFNDEFMNNISIVLNALDNVQAREYVDRRCVDFKIPLLECGTLGTIGSVQTIVPYRTETYSSMKNTNDDNIPLCTLKMFPSTYEHVASYARSCFDEYFVNMHNLYLKHLEHLDSKDIDPPTQEAIKTIDLYSTPESCVEFAHKTFDKIFNKDIQDIIKQYPRDFMEDSKPFWSGSKIFPQSIKFDSSNPTHIDFVFSFSNIWAESIGLPNLSRDKCVKVVKFKSKSKSKIKVNPIRFEKDDDSNHHIDFVHSVATIRSMNYSIEPKDRLETKGIAGKIIPAIPTTTSIVSGLMMIELVKLLYDRYCNRTRSNEDYRYGTFNLANSMYAFGECMKYRSKKIHNRSYNIWTQDEFGENRTLQDIVDHYTDIGEGELIESSSTESTESTESIDYIVDSIFLNDELIYNESNIQNLDITLKDLSQKHKSNVFYVHMIKDEETADLEELQNTAIDIRFKIKY